MHCVEVNCLQKEKRGLWGEVAAFVLLIALFAPVRLYLPWTLVPLVLQNSLFLFLPLFVSCRAVAISWVMLMGATFCGFPCLAGGVAGAALFTAPTLGYLLGYGIAALTIAGPLQKTQLSVVAKMVIGNFLIWLSGMSYLAPLIGLEKAFFMGVVPFILTDLAKTMILSGAYLRMFKATGRAGMRR